MAFKSGHFLFKFIFLAIIFSIFITCAPERKARKGFVAKPCMDCHKEMKSELAKKYVHVPMSERDCEACHLRHGRLAVKSFVEREEKKLCFTCHTGMAADVENMAGVHTVIKQGKCLPCHDAHASDNTSLQKEVGNEQCFTCHDKAPFMRAKRHKPLDKGCLTCHAAHGSQYKDNLIIEETGLCRSCHNFTEKGFRNAHRDYPVEQAECSGCHSPHSSSNDKLLRESIHEPLRLAQCDSCHNPNTGPDPIGVIAPD
ncbi:MAG TPA: cytochrome C, partial [Nitrospirae bacterium]|nr:cytochrome C [Nitrospirota bacterium]